MLRRTIVSAGLCLIVLGTKAQVRDSSTVVKDSVILQEKEDERASIPIVTLDETDSDNSSAAGQNISSILYAGRDPFYSNVLNFNAARFKIRGYNADYFETYMNGIPMRNLTNGTTLWSLWGGLNDVMRNRQSATGLRPVDYGYSDIGGSTSIDTRASHQRKQLNLSYTGANGNYNHRGMASWSSGMSANGWAFSVAASFRYAKEGYVPGTFYENGSYFVAIDKKINSRHLLSFVTFGSPTVDGGQAAATKEMYQLAGTHYYNPSWGYQDGKKRSANYTSTYQPYAMLNHEWKIDNTSRLNTAVSYSYGERARTGLDWYNAPDPRPDYYRNLPSFATDDKVKQFLTQLYSTNESVRQINWSDMYNTNRINTETVNDVDGDPAKSVTGKRAYYILEDRVVRSAKFNFSSIYNKQLSKHTDLTAGLYYSQQRDHNYERVHDLLGGDYWLNINKFAQQTTTSSNDAQQFDLDHPNRVAKKGDKFGYDYDMNVSDAKAFLQGAFHYNHVDFFVSGAYNYDAVYRLGNVRNGLYPDNSKGKSKVYTFNNYAFKGGVTYKIDGRNYLFGNASISTRAPYVENIFFSPRYHNQGENNTQAEQVISGEAGYVRNSEKLKLRVTGYYAQFQHGLDVMSYYDDSYASFVNYALSGIGKVHYGIEFGLDAPIYKGLKVVAAANIGRYYYNSREHAVVTLDNSSQILSSETVYIKNYNVGQAPQEVYTVGLNYQGNHNWFVNVNANYFNKTYLEVNPVRHTSRAIDGVEAHSALYNSILAQEQLPSQTTVDLYGGKTWNVHVSGKPASVIFTAGVYNLLNNKDLVSGGFEQLRYNYTDKNPASFPPKYYYAYGLNFFASLAFRL